MVYFVQKEREKATIMIYSFNIVSNLSWRRRRARYPSPFARSRLSAFPPLVVYFRSQISRVQIADSANDRQVTNIAPTLPLPPHQFTQAWHSTRFSFFNYQSFVLFFTLTRERILVYAWRTCKFQRNASGYRSTVIRHMRIIYSVEKKTTYYFDREY